MSEAAAVEAGPVDMFNLVGTILDRKFRIEKLVAEGGFGVVYYGMHLTLEKPVAVKVLKTPPEFNDKARAQFIEKFALEGKTMARISHPNIVQVLDFGASPMPSGELAPWMVLEWITGETLEALLMKRRGKGGFSVAEAYSVCKPVLDALAYAHDEGIAHRDIKPANMMVVVNKRGSTLRLMDFGIAKLMEDGESAGTGATRTRTTMNAFSPQYAAPEQISGTRTGPWTDVHAMALIITEMLTDRNPYDGEDMTTLFGQILNPSRPTPANRGLSSTTWEPVLARALALKPDERYHNAAEFMAALEAAMPTGEAAGSQTGAFRALGGGGGATAIPTGLSATVSPTTLRGSAVSTGVEATPQKSKTPMYLGLGLVLVLGAIGAAVFLGKAGTQAAPPATHTAVQPATVVTPPATTVVGNNGNTAANTNAAAGTNPNPTANAGNPPANGTPTANPTPNTNGTPSANANGTPTANPTANANTSPTANAGTTNTAAGNNTHPTGNHGPGTGAGHGHGHGHTPAVIQIE